MCLMFGHPIQRLVVFYDWKCEVVCDCVCVCVCLVFVCLCVCVCV